MPAPVINVYLSDDELTEPALVDPPIIECEAALETPAAPERSHRRLCEKS